MRPAAKSGTAGRAAIVAGLVLLYLAILGFEPPVHPDTARDLLLARDGLELGLFEGSPTGIGGLRQGLLWIRFLALTFAAGPLFHHLCIVGLLALSVGLFDRLARHHFGEDIGWEPTAIFLPLVMGMMQYPVLWHHSLAPIGIVLSTAALLRVAIEGTLVAAVALALSVYLVTESHVTGILLVPVFVVSIVAFCHRPATALALGSASATAAAFVCSANTVLFNARALLRESWYSPAFVTGLLLVGAVALLFRSRCAALGVEERRRWAVFGAVFAVALQTVMGSVASGYNLVNARYYLVALPSAVLLVALVLRRLRQASILGKLLSASLPTILLLSPVPISLLQRTEFLATPPMPRYRLREAALLARYFGETGYAFPDLQHHLRGPNSLDLLSSIAPFAAQRSVATKKSSVDLRMVAFAGGVPPAVLRAGATEVSLVRGRHAAILPIEGWVRHAPSRFCIMGGTGYWRVEECVDVAEESIGRGGRYLDLAYASMPGTHDAFSRFVARGMPWPVRMTWELPIEIEGDDIERHFNLTGVILSGVIDAPWVIERIDGVGHRGQLPARHVVIDRTGAMSGRMLLAVDRPTQVFYPPDFLETTPDETALRASVFDLGPRERFFCELFRSCP